MKKCIAAAWSGHGYGMVSCKNPAKYGKHCGVHSPERQAERAAKRGPTQFERDLAIAKDRRQKLDALLAAARRVCYHGGATEDLIEALKAYET